MILRSKQRNHNTQQVEGGKSPPLQCHRRETGAKKSAKNEERDRNLAVLEKKQNKIKNQDYPLHISSKSSPFWMTGLQNIPTNLGGGKKKEKEETRKRTPIKRHKRLVHLNKPFELVPPENNSIKIQSRSFSCLPL